MRTSRANGRRLGRRPPLVYKGNLDNLGTACLSTPSTKIREGTRGDTQL